ncbi:MAG: hypothetical protein QF535_10210, partial [Anaerolineales bacterium]|nr:hypothetical protein [Anaerolineales bacterium]
LIIFTFSHFMTREGSYDESFMHVAGVVPSFYTKVCVSLVAPVNFWLLPSLSYAGISKSRVVSSGILESVISVFCEPVVGIEKVYVNLFTTGLQSP